MLTLCRGVSGTRKRLKKPVQSKQGQRVREGGWGRRGGGSGPEDILPVRGKWKVLHRSSWTEESTLSHSPAPELHPGWGCSTLQELSGTTSYWELLTAKHEHPSLLSSSKVKSTDQKMQRHGFVCHHHEIEIESQAIYLFASYLVEII